MFYLCINVGSLGLIATTEVEQRVGFWSAYLLCLCIFCVGLLVLVVGKKSYVVRPPKGSIIVNAFRAMWIGITHKGNMGKFLQPKAWIRNAHELQMPQNRPTKLSMAEGSPIGGTTCSSTSSSVVLSHVGSSSSIQFTGLCIRRC